MVGPITHLYVDPIHGLPAGFRSVGFESVILSLNILKFSIRDHRPSVAANKKRQRDFNAYTDSARRENSVYGAGACILI